MATQLKVQGTLKIWLWVSVALAVGGALLLYPIGTALTDILFIAVKVGMVTGLLILLLAHRLSGFWIWAAFSVCAVVMTIIKCTFVGGVSFLTIGSMVVDIVMPLGVIFLMGDSKVTR